MAIKSVTDSIRESTPRTLEQFVSLFKQVEAIASDSVRNSQEQRAIIASTIIFCLTRDGWAGRLPFSYGEAYLAVDSERVFVVAGSLCCLTTAPHAGVAPGQINY